MKEIIIDGVNVARCNLYMEHLHEDAYEDDGCVDVDNFCCLHMDECKKCPNCYYKQLKRLEQDNARLKKIIYGDANTIRPTVCVADEDYEKAIIGNAIYRKAFEEIRGIAKIENIPDIISPNDLATFYIERTQQLKKIQNKVNEVL